jgi:hypothetical protein
MASDDGKGSSHRGYTTEQMSEILRATRYKLSKVAESFGLICIVGCVWPRARCWRSSFFPVTTSVFPFDQTHVDESEDRARTRECDLDRCSTRVSRAFRLWEQISRANAGTKSVFIITGRSRLYLRNGLCEGNCEGHRNSTSGLATSVVGRPGDDQGSAD